MMKYLEIQKEIIENYRIKIDECSTCWGRMHAHIKERKVCKWHPKSSVRATFDLLHEIGHIETTKSGMRRCESEYYATKWALERAEEYDIKIPDSIIKVYQEYINMELDRGKRRHGSGYAIDMTL